VQVVYLKKAFNQSGLTKKKMKELVIRSLYVEMLGLDASFAYIRGVELCASTSITQKRVGYLAGIVSLQPVIFIWFNFARLRLQLLCAFLRPTNFDLCSSIKSNEI
jgi:hypothetical protein